MFFAGFLAILYVVARLLHPLSERDDGEIPYPYGLRDRLLRDAVQFRRDDSRRIWADQSWGRFWGWDPKENGALLIVIWCAVILHARWGGMVRERGLMALAIFGNVVTSFSWFGVNMLGVGLHSYGFMDKAFQWLMAFIITQLVLIALSCSLTATG